MRILTPSRHLPFPCFRRWRQVGACLLMLGTLAAAEPTVSRIWTSTNGFTVNARVLRMEGAVAVLERADGPVVRVPLTALVEADRQFLRAHFGAAAPSGSNAPAASGLPFETGEVSGPVQATEGISYHVYLPKSLKQGRKAPLMFMTHGGGGKSATLISNLAEGAEVSGMILALSVESRNGMEREEYEELTEACLDHLMETLPIDPERVYFTGMSGGGAVAMRNTSNFKCNGAMPHIAYNPSGNRPAKGFYYVTGGAKDYNRYLSAEIARMFGDNAVHRMIPGGHTGGPAWQKSDGVFWLNARYLGANKMKHADEALDFEARTIEWLRGLPAKESHRAYSNGRVLKDDYQLSGPNLPALEALLAELAEDPLNVRFHEGLVEIDQFSKKEFSKYGNEGSLFEHEDKSITRKAELLLEKYRGVPVIEDVITDMALPTVGR